METSEMEKYKGFKACVEFHGHLCPGLSLGYRAARAGMERLEEMRAEDEEIVAIVENDSCFADAIQVITGCTFGKGNFIYKDNGKMVLTLLSRKTGKGVRVSCKGGRFKFSHEDEYFELFAKIQKDKATHEERLNFRHMQEKRSLKILEMNIEELFSIENVQIEIPLKARIFKSEPCELCGEMTMATKLVNVGGKMVCRDCAKLS